MKVTPVRLQRKRTKGYNLQAVSRSTNGLACIVVSRPARWGNPYDVGIYGRELSMMLFRNSLNGVWDSSLVQHLGDEVGDATYGAHEAFLKRLGAHPLALIAKELGASNLACYCPASLACHADILLSLANP